MMGMKEMRQLAMDMSNKAKASRDRALEAEAYDYYVSREDWDDFESKPKDLDRLKQLMKSIPPWELPS